MLISLLFNSFATISKHLEHRESCEFPDFFEIEEGFRATQKSVPLAHRISKICTECAAMYSNVQNGNVQELLHVACIINFSDCSAQLLWCRLGYGFQEFVKFISHLMLMKLTHWSILILCVTTSTLW